LKSIIFAEIFNINLEVNKKVTYKNIGLIDYKKAWDYQENLFAEILAVKELNRKDKNNLRTYNHVLFCEHPHVYTIGKSGNQENLLISNEFLANKGATLLKINRGGDITYHGPGQLVGYPILDLENFQVSIKEYIYGLEDVIINVLQHYNISGTRVDGATGVWLDAGNNLKERKICAFGIRASHLVTMHGFALNVNTDLEYFGYIVPCGLKGKGVTSLQNEVGRHIDIDEVSQLIIKEFNDVFGMEFI
jgi:lipoyl(octanoyl) transferase